MCRNSPRNDSTRYQRHPQYRGSVFRIKTLVRTFVCIRRHLLGMGVLGGINSDSKYPTFETSLQACSLHRQC